VHATYLHTLQYKLHFVNLPVDFVLNLTAQVLSVEILSDSG